MTKPKSGADIVEFSATSRQNKYSADDVIDQLKVVPTIKEPKVKAVKKPTAPKEMPAQEPPVDPFEQKVLTYLEPVRVITEKYQFVRGLDNNTVRIDRDIYNIFEEITFRLRKKEIGRIVNSVLREYFKLDTDGPK